jgi:hypothetical protein
VACAALLVCAVGLTWYGPSKEDPRIEMLTPQGLRCGKVVQIASGRIMLETPSGRIDVDLMHVDELRAVDKCSGQRS